MNKKFKLVINLYILSMIFICIGSFIKINCHSNLVLVYSVIFQFIVIFVAGIYYLLNKLEKK